MRHLLNLSLWLVAASVARAEVHVIMPTDASPSGMGPLQDAIDAAADGDVIVLSHCNYAPCFTEGQPVFYEYSTTRADTYAGIPVPDTTVIDGKSLTIVGELGIDAEPVVVSGPLLVLGVEGKVEIRNVLFSATSFKPAILGEYQNDLHYVRVLDSTGHVQFERCRFWPGAGYFQPNVPLPAEGAIELTGGSVDLVLKKCLVYAPSASQTGLLTPKAALTVGSGSHRVAIYDSVLVGGAGTGTPGGEPGGAHGIHLRGRSELSLFGSSVSGGVTFPWGAPSPTPGGDAIRLEDDSTAVLVATELVPGSGSSPSPELVGAPVHPPEAATAVDASVYQFRLQSPRGGFIEAGVPVKVVAIEDAEEPLESQPIVLLFSRAGGWTPGPEAWLGILHAPSAADLWIRAGVMEDGKFVGVFPSPPEDAGSFVLHAQAFLPRTRSGRPALSEPSFLVWLPEGVAY